MGTILRNTNTRPAAGRGGGVMEEKNLRELVVAAIKLAIVRHDLVTDDCTTINDEDADAIAIDTWLALLGEGTCSGEVAPELSVLLPAVG